ncbi:MAG TPA: endonuclease V, partial [Deinococcales bacterium]|nr:endonuclease V [Deinococcales bacterium]
ATATLEPDVPYVPGFLSFREAPVLELALSRLPRRPQLLWVDGHGLTHPRRAGIATHLGVRQDLPSLGVAKKLLAGTLDPLPAQAGATAAIRVNGEVRGYAWQSKLRALPVFVSAGHRCSPEAALAFAQSFFDGYRLPWPTRAAHDASNVARRAWLAGLPPETA